MSEKGFEPLSSQLGIAGTSYRIQLGLINGKWASRLMKGNSIIDSYVYKDEDVTEGGYPNLNYIVGWVIRTVAIPNINPHQIMKTTQVLVKQAIDKRDERKVMAPISETKEVELERVPDNELKRLKATGWVKDDRMVSEEDRRQAFKERMIAKKEEELAKADTEVTMVKTTRDLPSIPKAEQAAVKTVSEGESSRHCPHCGKDLDWKFCPYCGKPLPH
jgi:hypothetical protein